MLLLLWDMVTFQRSDSLDMFQGVLGWFLLRLFTVALLNKVLL